MKTILSLLLSYILQLSSMIKIMQVEMIISGILGPFVGSPAQEAQERHTYTAASPVMGLYNN